jgi:hypothetical protein
MEMLKKIGRSLKRWLRKLLLSDSQLKYRAKDSLLAK